MLSCHKHRTNHFGCYRISLFSKYLPSSSYSLVSTSFRHYRREEIRKQNSTASIRDMENPEDNTPKIPSNPPGSVAPVDVENQSSSSYTSILRRWRREDVLKKGQVLLRTIGFIFSLLSFIIMAANRHGDWKNFDKYEEYRYLLAIAILSTIYTIAQVLRQIHEFSTGIFLLSQRGLNLLDFFGDQIMAYLLMSAASTAIPLTNRMREGADNIFTDSSSAAISMAFFAFIAMAMSALISGYKLSSQTYI